jgi:hypothetical protein
MNLANYINDLLYRYNCVIIPDFGGFVTNKISAKMNKTSNTFYPPSKQITFNSHLKVNDGLLANYIALSENISFEKASNIIAISVIKWKNEIKTKPIQIAAVGVLTLNESGQISFGFTPIESESITRSKAHVIPLIPIVEMEERKGIPAFIKYAATAAVLLTLSFVGNNVYQQNKQQTILASQEKAIEKRIQSATFVIANPLPTLELNVAKKLVIEKKYHVVAGAFQFPENAKRKVNQLKEQGYNARILGVNKWGLIEVAFNSFADRNDAINNLYKIQDTVSGDAWLLIKK